MISWDDWSTQRKLRCRGFCTELMFVREDVERGELVELTTAQISKMLRSCLSVCGKGEACKNDKDGGHLIELFYF